MFEQSRYARIAWIPILSGLAWLWCASHEGLVVGFLFSAIPGCLLLASGVSTLLWPGDLRIAQFTALGGLAGMPLAIPAFLTVGVARSKHAWHCRALIPAGRWRCARERSAYSPPPQNKIRW